MSLLVFKNCFLYICSTAEVVTDKGCGHRLPPLARFLLDSFPPGAPRLAPLEACSIPRLPGCCPCLHAPRWEAGSSRASLPDGHDLPRFASLPGSTREQGAPASSPRRCRALSGQSPPSVALTPRFACVGAAGGSLPSLLGIATQCFGVTCWDEALRLSGSTAG